MRKLSVALQKGNAATFCTYRDWRNSRDLGLQGRTGRLGNRGHLKRRQDDSFLYRPSVPRFDHCVSVRA